MTIEPNSNNSTTAGDFSVVLMTGAPPRVVVRLLEEIRHSSTQNRIAGVLYGMPKPKPVLKRIRNIARQLHQPTYLRYVANRILGAAENAVRRVGRTLWKTVHASFRKTDSFDLTDLEAYCQRAAIPFHVTTDFHCDETIDFVRSGQPDLGIVYGTPVLKPRLFELPIHGCINLHQRKVPEYRGGGPIGLWELLAGENELGITIHRVASKLDAGPIIRTATIPIESADTLTSLGLKAHVVGIDLIVSSIRSFVEGTVEEIPQTGHGQTYRNPKPEDMAEINRVLKIQRPESEAEHTYPRWKTAGRFLLLTPWLLIRNWHRRLTGSFPVVVLYHHVITDRQHFMGMSTDQFVKQLEYLHRYYDVVDLETARKRLKTGRISAPTVVLTFDDGYADNVLNLRAASLAYDIPAMMYVSSNHLQTGTRFAHDLERGHEDFVPMSWQQLQQLERWGIQFGAHTRNHFDCGSQDSAILMEEIAISKLEIEQHSAAPVTDFSFPFGLPENISRQAFEIATQTFESVASAYGGTNFTGQAGPQHVYRLPHLTDIAELELQLQSVLVFGQPDFWTGGLDHQQSESASTGNTPPARELAEV